MSQEPKVRFIIGGAQKSGTSALAAMLMKHPQLFIPQQKELHFFNRSAAFRLDCFAMTRWWLRRSYESWFTQTGDSVVCGEATPDYMYWEPAPGHIWRYNPYMKWIILLRHPTYRARSAWAMNSEAKRENLSLREAMDAEPLRASLFLPYQDVLFAYLERGFYAHQIRRLIRIFGRNQLLFLTTQELRDTHHKSLSEVLRFLEVDDELDVEQRVVRKGVYHTDMDRDFFCELLELYRSDIAATQQLIGKDLSPWLSDDYIESEQSV